MTNEISKVVNQQKSLMDLMEEIRLLKEKIIQRDQKIEQLDQRIDDLEQQIRSKDLIITGLEPKHRSYARAAAGVDEGEDAPTEELQTLFLNGKNIHLEMHNISNCHTIPNKDRKRKPAIVIQLVSVKQKIDLLQQSKKLKGTGVYINEHLTKKKCRPSKMWSPTQEAKQNTSHMDKEWEGVHPTKWS